MSESCRSLHHFFIVVLAAAWIITAPNGANAQSQVAEIVLAAKGGTVTRNDGEVCVQFGYGTDLSVFPKLSELEGINNVSAAGCTATEDFVCDVLRIDSLDSLDLECSDVNNAFSTVKPLPKLKELDISFTLVSDFSFVSTLDSLTVLHMGGVLVKDEDVKHLLKLKSLASLDLSQTSLSSTAISKLSELPRLEHLALHDCCIDDTNFEMFFEFPSLKHLYLGYLKEEVFGTSLPSGLSAASIAKLAEKGIKVYGAPAVKESGVRVGVRGLAGKIEYRSLTFEQIKTFGNRDGIVVLVGSKQVNDDICKLIYHHLPNLEELNLAGTAITDQSIQWIHGFTKLKKLDLTNTRVSDIGFNKYWRTGSKIDTLELRNTCVVGTGLSPEKFPELRTLNLTRFNPQWPLIKHCPCMTNEGLAAIAKLTTLERLDFAWESNLDHAKATTSLGSIDNLKTVCVTGKLFSSDEIKYLKKYNPSLKIEDDSLLNGPFS